ncbi:MAG: hypothetical protein LBN30_03535 [Oscillospiraceae bacterium]|nr:hypothetical protein [Oscillospiraceae bacterium]
MKKFLVLTLLVLVLLVTAACGNKQVFDTTYTFNWAVIELPNGNIVEGDVESWKDFDDGDQLQVKIDGVTYLVHSSKIVLMTERPA